MTATWEPQFLSLLGVLLLIFTGAVTYVEGFRRGASFLIAWILPGAGHVVMGKWRKGLFLFALLGATYLFGLYVVGFRSVAFDDNPFYYVGRYGSGATLFLAKFMSVERSFPREELDPSWYDPGLLYICVVGLLNLVLMMNVLELRLPDRTKADAPRASDPPKEAPAGPTTNPAPTPENPA